MTSDRYAVQYQIGDGAWTNVRVYISYYGETLGSPYRSDSGYTVGSTSMSFVNIPVTSNTIVRLRVAKVFGTPFQFSDFVSVRPSVKPVSVVPLPDGSVQISTATGANFGGEQFILWWNRGADGGGVESLAFFLNPPYTEPTGANVLTVNTVEDLPDTATLSASAYDTIDFEGMVAIGTTGAVALEIPSNILNIFFGPDAWVQGKLRFDLADMDPGTGVRKTRTIYGPGVLDVSRFNYLNRACAGTDDEYYALSSSTTVALDHYKLDGIAILDINHAANNGFFNSSVNNVKVLGWNSENGALRLDDNTAVANVFIRSGDDSLMMWGSPVTITNATVWQNFNGGVVNLGWDNNSHDDYDTIDGLYVIKTDWQSPTSTDWTANPPPGPPAPLQSQNNAVIASLMTPGTKFGNTQPPTIRNVFVEDPPQVLFSLKILPPICATNGVFCPPNPNLAQGSKVHLNIENLFSPSSSIGNSIGFQNVPAGYVAPGSAAFTSTGDMSINMKNVFIKSGFIWLPLLSFDATGPIGKIGTNGNNVNIVYSVGAP
ncbi:MAG TPA: hypothetical protein VGP62_26885 [Bryobacteraceae bacterium]|nr:hypothetical protein [Bryobacteraceae bacterium]